MDWHPHDSTENKIRLLRIEPAREPVPKKISDVLFQRAHQACQHLLTTLGSWRWRRSLTDPDEKPARGPAGREIDHESLRILDQSLRRLPRHRREDRGQTDFL